MSMFLVLNGHQFLILKNNIFFLRPRECSKSAITVILSLHRRGCSSQLSLVFQK